MGVNPATFSSAGQVSQHYIPGAYSRNNFISNEGGGASTGNIAILGYSNLGEPGKLLIFGSDNDARAELAGGEGLEGVVQAFNPGNDLAPAEVGFIRVNQGTQSSRTLQKSAVDVFGIKSSIYGVPANQMRVKFSAGTNAGTHQLQIEYKGETEEFDNIELKSISLQYTGAGSAATVTIDQTKLVTAVTGGPGGEDLDITLADYSTISELIDYINNQGVYDAVLLSPDETDSPEELDFVTAGDIFTSALTLKSDYQQIYEVLEASVYLSDITKEGVNREVPEYDANYVYLTGATAGSYTTQDFSDALEVLEQADVQLIATTSTDAAVHILIKNHCVKMNSVTGRRERQFYVGGALGETVEERVARANILNSSFGALCAPGFYGFDDSGNEKLYAPSFLACQQVGMVSALALNTPTTFKVPNVLAWENDYKTTEQNALIKGGVLTGAKDQKGLFKIIRSISTFQSPLLQKNEMSIMRETLYQAADLRSRMENALIGTPNLGSKQLALVDSIFLRAIADWSGQGIIVDNGGQLYSGYTRKIVGDQVVIEYNTWNTAPTNFVFITHNVSLLVQN